ncbi:MAG: hypothetical protein IJP78_05235 [Clostridia bacterium]|nr:hypothetical protein [Clostridia bacterium]MBQ6960366.1 hypothetical protein [Clostridia bacterium]
MDKQMLKMGKSETSLNNQEGSNHITCHRTLQERAEAYDGELHLFDELNWGEPVGDEVW